MVAPKSFVEQLRALAEQRGDARAIIFVDSHDPAGVICTYASLDRRARAIAAILQERATPGDRAVLMLRSGLAYVSAFFGCLYAGVVPAPAFPPEARRDQHQARLRGILGDAEPGVILVHAGGEEAARATLENGQSPTILAVETIGDDAAALWTPYTPASHDLALLQYTSGSTSQPKGVMVSHDNLIANARAMHHALSTSVEDRVVSWLPLYHDMGLMGGLLQPLYSGAPCILMPPQLFLARPMRWLEAISTHRGTVSGGPDFAYRLCVDRIADDAVAALDLSSWELAFSGSETVRADTLNAFAEKFAPAGFDHRAFCPCYGQAEATLFVSGGRRGEGVRATGFDTEKLKGGIAAPAAGDATPIVACGRPQPGHDVVIIDPVTQAPLPDGGVGEIWVSGPVVTQGYWRRPQVTAQTFVLRGGKRYLRSGDLGFFHEGQLHIAGRSKDLIIIRGQNLYPQDIEQCLEREIDLLRNGRIAAFAIERDGREGIGIAAEVSRTAQKLVRPEMLARLISETVAEGFSEPARVVALLNPGGLPRTSSGKLQRSAARQGWEAGTLDCFATFTDGVLAGQAPTSEALKEQEWTPTARQLATIWGEVLGVDGIDLDASFFMLGGNSIAAVQILTRINDAFGIELEAGALFGSPSLRGLAAAVDEALPREASAVAVPIIATGGSASVLSYGQRRMWFLWELGGDGAVHHISGGLRLEGALDHAALAAALGQLSLRHEALRTVLRRLPDGEAEQVIQPEAEVRLSFEDLSGLPEAGRQARLEALSAGEARTPFDLERGPLLRATLLRLRAERHVLLLTMHHIISDGWSVRILLGELLRLYDAACQGEDARLPPLPIRYADYAAWQSPSPARYA